MDDKTDYWIVGVKFMRFFYTVYSMDQSGQRSVGIQRTKMPVNFFASFPLWVWIVIGASGVLIIVMIVSLIIARRSLKKETINTDKRFEQLDDDETEEQYRARISIHQVDTERSSSFANDPVKRYSTQNSRTWLSQVKNANK